MGPLLLPEPVQLNRFLGLTRERDRLGEAFCCHHNLVVKRVEELFPNCTFECTDGLTSLGHASSLAQLVAQMCQLAHN